MTDFRSVILKLIGDYKNIIKKELTTANFSAFLKHMKLKRSYLRDMSDVELYRVSLNIVSDLKGRYDKPKFKATSVNHYSGVSGFIKYLENVLEQYCIDGNKVVNLGHRVSVVLLNAIQMINNQKENDIVKIEQLRDYANIISIYGNDEQKRIFTNMVRHIKLY